MEPATASGRDVRLGDVSKGGRFRTRLTGRDGVVIGTDGIGIEVRWIEPDSQGVMGVQGVAGFLPDASIGCTHRSRWMERREGNANEPDRGGSVYAVRASQSLCLAVGSGQGRLARLATQYSLAEMAKVEVMAGVQAIAGHWSF